MVFFVSIFHGPYYNANNLEECNINVHLIPSDDSPWLAVYSGVVDIETTMAIVYLAVQIQVDDQAKNSEFSYTFMPRPYIS
jgi:hypothetical protein